MGNKIIHPPEEADVANEQEVVESEQTMPAETAPAVVTTDMNATGDTTGTKKMLRIFVELIMLAVVVYLAMWGYGLQTKNRDLQKQIDTLNSNPVVAEQRKTNDLVTKVGALVQLPTNEAPQAALVSDSVALKKQYPFFTDVQNGDQVLFYVKAGKVFVYRPSTNKIVQTGPLSVNDDATATTTVNTKSTR